MTRTSRLRVLVTAGASGIGKAIALRFAATGHDVLVCDIDERALSTLARESERIATVDVDVSRTADVQRAIEAVASRLGGLDVLINNAGIAGPSGSLEDLDPDAWRRTFEVNVDGAFLMMRAVVPGMKSQGSGCIVNVSTSSTVTGIPGRSAYVASKWAIEGLTRNAARELGSYGIRVNAVRPGYMNSPRMSAAVARLAQATDRSVAEVEHDIIRFISMRTRIEPVEVADLCLFLASEAARHVTGQLIAVDGNSEWEG